MLGAVGRYMKAFVYLITGRIDSARKAISRNPYVIQAQYDAIIREKTGNIHRYKEAVAVVQGRAPTLGLDERIARTTWQYARRQRTWFRRERDVMRLQMGDNSSVDRLADTVLEHSA